MTDIHFHGFWRMDWGLGNPNKTAALIATLMIGVWFLTCFWRGGFWIALVLFTGLGFSLIHTYSRGGFIGAVAGLTVMLWHVPRPWPWPKVYALVLSILILVGSAFYLQAAHRFGQGLISEDRSIGNRLDIWKVAPRMMVDAPTGWGFGQSGAAYMQWYQPVDRRESYRTLVNSHLTWLVEVGWLERFLYVFSWLTIFMLCWPSNRLRVLAISLGVWITFFVAATFSTVAESPLIWLVPSFSFLVALVIRLRTATWPHPRVWLVPLGAASVFIIGLFIAGHLTSSWIQKKGKAIIVGKGRPTTCILVDTKVCGRDYGKTLRRFLSTASPKVPSFELVEPGRFEVNSAPRRVIVAGSVPTGEGIRLERVLANARQILLLNPTFFPQELKMPESFAAKCKAVFGEFSQSPSSESWSNFALVERIGGGGDYLPNWPGIVFQDNWYAQ